MEENVNNPVSKYNRSEDNSSVPLNASANASVNAKIPTTTKIKSKKNAYLNVLLPSPSRNVETIRDDIAKTTEGIKQLKHVQIRSNSTGKLYQSSRRVSFPENDNELVTGYLEPADPWACVKPASCVSELAEFYRDSCIRHNVAPIESIMKHLDALDLNSNSRRPILNLREQTLTAESCEALEEVLKRIQYKLIDLTDCGLDDASATALFDMIEYYEAANEIDISENRNITNRGWQACINMVKRSHALQILVTRGTPLSESNAISLGKSMLGSSLNTLKLEHCGLSGRPMASLCTYLRRNSVLKELWLAYNDLTCDDAYNIGIVLKSNFYLQFLDLSNNNIQDRGILHVTEALIEQANYFKVLNGSSSTTQQQQQQPMSSKQHTLTRGDKFIFNGKTDKESKYECLAQLINSAKTVAPAILASIEPIALSATKSADVQLNKGETDGTSSSTKNDAIENDDAEKPSVTIVENSDNNNELDKEIIGPVTSALAIPTDAIATNETAQEIVELKIVEHIDQSEPANDKQKSSDNDDDLSLAASNSTTSYDSSEKSADLDAKTNLDNNNSSLSENNKEIATVQSQDEQTSKTNPISSVQNDCVDKAEELKESVNTIAVCDLDINENKSNIKLNYAEVVKVDNSMENQLFENRNFDGIEENRDKVVNKNYESTSKMPSDLDAKVQIDGDDVGAGAGAVVVKTRPMEVSLPKPIKTNYSNKSHDHDDEMSPICKIRLPLNSPRLVKSKDILSELPLTPDSSHSLDSSCEYSTPFEIKQYNTPIIPERSFSSESLNSETSIESNDSKSSIKLTEAKFTKNGTLERQNSSAASVLPPAATPNGLQVLMLWNNHITRNASQSISDLLAATTTLEILNVGKNVLSNDFVTNIKTSLKSNTSLTSLGLQSVHLTNDGVKTLSEILDFGGNVTLQRVDLRDNNLQVSGLASLNEVLKSNKSITRIDLDDVPRRANEHTSDSSIDYNRVVNNIRSLCARNENPPEPEPVRTSVKRVRANFLNSRKISLTCQSIRNPVLDSPQVKADRHLLDPTRKSGRLRSPLPSPIPSPVLSPIPSPSRSRFQVSRVVESNVSPITPPSSNSCSPTSFTPTSRFRVTIVEPPKLMSAPVTIINSTNKQSIDTSQQQKEQQPEQLVQPKPLVPVIQTSQVSPIRQIKEETRSEQDPHPKVVIKPSEQQIATTLTMIDTTGNSFDSPDLEVKGYMDDSCSSFSSLDSIGRGHDFNTSLSSIENYDILGDNKFNSDGVGSSLHRQNQHFVKKNLSNSSIESVEMNKIENSGGSSLEASTCSNDSIYGSQEFPVLKISSNEGTLTNSPVSPCSGEITQSDDKESMSTKSDEKRVRKTSWISRGDAVPATLDKLLSIFHHPGNLFFTRSSNGEAIKKDAPQQTQTNTQENGPPSRKESPMGSLFAWTKKENVFDETVDSKSVTPDVTVKTIKSPLQPNISPDNTITAESVTIEAIPVQLKQDVKENVSPEHTVTADSMANLQSKTISTQTPIIIDANVAAKLENPSEILEKEKVHFEVGGDEDDDDDDDDYESNVRDSSMSRHSTNTTVINVGKALGLGQITRDSMSILKGSSNNSQDSIRSLESLSEIVFEEEQLPQ